MSLDGGHAQDVPQPRPPARVIEISYVIGRPDHAFDGPPKHRGIDGARTALADGDTTGAPQPLEPLITPSVTTVTSVSQLTSATASICESNPSCLSSLLSSNLH